MKGYSKFGAVAAVAILAVMAVPASMSAQGEGGTWTFMVYMDADNNLELYGDMNLEWLESVGSTEDVNIVVLIDRYSVEGVELLLVNERSSEAFGGDYWTEEKNMADPQVLREFVVTSLEEYPADKTALVLWDHGGGWRGICWDDTTMEDTGEDDCLTMNDLREALYGAVNDTGEMLDIVAFDACLMAMPEVAYQLRESAKYVVFSEETVGGYGFPYDAIARDLVDDHSMDAVGLCTVIAERFDEYYSAITAYGSYTISAFDMEYMDDIFDAVDALGTALDARLKDYMNYYQKDMIFADRYYYPYFVDLMGFAQNLIADKLIKDNAIKAAAKDVVSAVEDGVVVSLNGFRSANSHGLCIYLPSTNDGMHSMKVGYDEVPFAVETSWYDFVWDFSNFYGRTWGL